MRDIRKLFERLPFVDANVESLDGVASKEALLDIYKELFHSVLVGLRMANSRDMERYLCYEMMRERVEMYDLLLAQLPGDNGGVHWTGSQLVQESVELLINGKAKGVNYEELSESMLCEFYRLSPNTARLSEPSVQVIPA